MRGKLCPNGALRQESSSPRSTNAQQADIKIGWADLDTADTGVVGLTKYQLQNGVMQSAQIELESPTETALEPGNGGDLVYQGTEASLTQVLEHEIGHALGFADNANANSIMSYYLGTSNQTLSASDIAAAEALYGASFNASSGSSVGELTGNPAVGGDHPLLTSANVPFMGTAQVQPIAAALH